MNALLSRQTLLRFAAVHEGEQRVVTLLMAYAFFAGIGIYTYYIASTALFISDFDTPSIPRAYVAGGGLLFGCGLAFRGLQKRFALDRLVVVMAVVLLLSMAALGLGYRLTHNHWVNLAMFVWIRATVYISTVTFWLPASRIFGLEQARRLYGLISSGDVAASLLSYFLVNRLIAYGFIRTENLYLMAVGAMAVAVVLLTILVRENQAALRKTRAQSAAEAAPSLGRFLQNSYYLELFLLSLLPVFCYYVVEFIFSAEVKTEFPDREVLTRFMGQFLLFCSGAELAVKTLFFRTVVRYFGVTMGVLVLPVALAVVGGLLLLTEVLDYPTFFLVLLSRFLVISVRKSFNDTSIQALYQIIPRPEMGQVQAHIENYAKPLGYVAGGVVLQLLVWLDVSHLIQVITLFVLVALGWIGIAWSIRASYFQTVFGALEIDRKATAEQASPDPPPGPAPPVASPAPAQTPFSGFDELVLRTQSPDPGERALAAALLGASGRYRAATYLIRLLNDPERTVRREAVNACAALTDHASVTELLARLSDPELADAVGVALARRGEAILPDLARQWRQSETIEVRYRLIDILQQLNGSGSVRLLRQYLRHPDERIRMKIADALSQRGHMATTQERSFFAQEIRSLLERVVWLAAGRRDLRPFGEAEALQQALTREQQSLVARILTTLAVTTGDRRFLAIRDKLPDKEAPPAGFLQEVMFLMLPGELRLELQPIFEDWTPERLLQEYQHGIPQPELSVRERLCHLIQSHPAQLTVETRRLAIRTLGAQLRAAPPDPAVVRLLSAQAVSSSQAVAAEALTVLRQHAPGEYETLRNLLFQGL